MRVCSVDKADKEYEFDRVFAPQEDQATVRDRHTHTQTHTNTHAYALR